MAWLKARALDCGIWLVCSIAFFNCSKERESCQRAKWAGTEEAAAAPSQAELKVMACACAAGVEVGEDCAEDLWESRALADDSGCSAELDALLFCVEDGEACGDGEAAEWACDAPEAAWRACLGPAARADGASSAGRR
jgi:hypothetical protein